MKPIRNSEGGQLIIEAILLITVLLGIVLFVASEMKSKEMIAKLVSGPWSHLSGMIQNGVWMPADEAGKYHASHYDRVRSLLGKDAK